MWSAAERSCRAFLACLCWHKVRDQFREENRLWICSVIVRRTKTSPSSELMAGAHEHNRRQVNREVDLSIILRHNVTSGSSRPSQPTMNDLVLECLRTRQNKHGPFLLVLLLPQQWLYWDVPCKCDNSTVYLSSPVQCPVLKCFLRCSSADYIYCPTVIYLFFLLRTHSPTAKENKKEFRFIFLHA